MGLWKGFCVVPAIMVFLLYCLLGDEVISNFFKIYQVKGFVLGIPVFYYVGFLMGIEGVVLSV